MTGRASSHCGISPANIAACNIKWSTNTVRISVIQRLIWNAYCDNIAWIWITWISKKCSQVKHTYHFELHLWYLTLHYISICADIHIQFICQNQYTVLISFIAFTCTRLWIYPNHSSNIPKGHELELSLCKNTHTRPCINCAYNSHDVD